MNQAKAEAMLICSECNNIIMVNEKFYFIMDISPRKGFHCQCRKCYNKLNKINNRFELLDL